MNTNNTETEEAREARLAFLEKLAVMRSEVGSFKKDRRNPAYGSRYASMNSVLEAVLPVLAENGVVLEQDMIPDLGLDGPVTVETVLNDLNTGYCYRKSMSAIPKNRQPQGISDAVTYLSRVTLLNIFKLPQEDTDGNVSSGVETKPTNAKATFGGGGGSVSPEARKKESQAPQAPTSPPIQSAEANKPQPHNMRPFGAPRVSEGAAPPAPEQTPAPKRKIPF